MLPKIKLLLIVMATACIFAITLSLFEAGNVDAEKTAQTAKISEKPSIVALATLMKNFQDSLSDELLTDASFPLGHKESYSWTNVPARTDSNRGGIHFGVLSQEQLELFYTVLNAFLSDDGYRKASLITKKSEMPLSTIGPNFWNNSAYFIALFGNPSTDGSWGFQLDGHHLALNFLVHGDEVSIVPAFIGTNPATVSGIAVLGEERGNALTLRNSLNETQSKKAVQTGARRGLKVGPGNTTDPYLNYDYSDFEGIGLKASDMTTAQKQTLQNLIKIYVYNLETEFADVWMKDVDAVMDDTYFVWIGGTTENDPIYYRVFNPAVWIEFNDEGGGSTNHIHTITRSPNGKDYGVFALNSGPKTLLHHYLLADHHGEHKQITDYHIINP
ncbi:DUF3500 domain-containing protein [Candidatus Poribacteria bacterium]|nr:DUF3500 domain-containing protein [Candidatus Poribacteria bacterium]